MHFKGFLACLISLFHFITKVLFLKVKGKLSKFCSLESYNNVTPNDKNASRFCLCVFNYSFSGNSILKSIIFYLCPLSSFVQTTVTKKDKLITINLWGLT